jgi:hypothetical protein
MRTQSTSTTGGDVFCRGAALGLGFAMARAFLVHGSGGDLLRDFDGFTFAFLAVANVLVLTIRGVSSPLKTVARRPTTRLGSTRRYERVATSMHRRESPVRRRSMPSTFRASGFSHATFKKLLLRSRRLLFEMHKQMHCDRKCARVIIGAGKRFVSVDECNAMTVFEIGLAVKTRHGRCLFCRHKGNVSHRCDTVVPRCSFKEISEDFGGCAHYSAFVRRTKGKTRWRGHSGAVTLPLVW